MTRALGINHVALDVGSVEEALEFWRALFPELQLRSRSRGMAFIDLGDQFIALFEDEVEPRRAVDGDSATVLAPPLRFEDGDLHLGAPEPRVARWRDDGRSFVPAPRAGDLVSLHWDFVCDVLSPHAATALERANRRALAAVASGS